LEQVPAAVRQQAIATGTTWSNVTGSPIISGANYQMTVPTSGTQQYYKLTK